MSRIGNKVINLPAGVTCTVAADNTAVVKGPKGELSFKFNSEIKILVEETTITLTRPNDSVKALHGTSRAVLANMVKGVSEGYEKVLKIIGTGYKAELINGNVVLSLGYSHKINVTPPAGITFTVPKLDEIHVIGIDKEVVGQIAANIRAIRPVEPYHAYGIRYSDERVMRKVGKAAGKK